MKLLKGFMAVALITTALTGATYAAYVPANQAANTVKDLADVGYTSNKKLTITRAAIDLIFDATNPLDAGVGPSDAAKNAKAFLKGIVDGTVDKFAGASPAEKHAAFLTALDAALAKASPIELDLAAAGFNVAAAPVADKIQVGIDAFYAAISPVDPREALLRQAHALGITGRNADGQTVEDLIAELAGKTGAPREAVLVKAAAKNFGKGEDKSLAEKVTARLAHHSGGGKHELVGLDGNEAAIGAFHVKMKDAYKEGVTSAKLTPAQAAAVKFLDDAIELFDNGVVEDDTIDTGAIKADLAHQYPALLAAFAKLGVTISDLQGQVATLRKKK